MEKEEKEHVLTLRQFSEKTGISIKVIRRLINEGKLVSIKTKKCFYIDYEESMKILWSK